MIKIAIFGAAGSMGTRASNALKNNPEYQVFHVEGNAAGEAKLQNRGIEPTAKQEAIAMADIILLTVPDALIGQIAHEVVPQIKSGSMVICLDPAAPHAGRLPQRADITYFITHPAHPPVFNDEITMAARRDFFGSGLAKQAIVNALLQGPETDYAKGEKIAQTLFKPILRSHRVTVEQMAILEPALSETVCATCLTVIREAMDEAIQRGVPAAAARDFLMGHINVELAILFDEIDWELSQGAKEAVTAARSELLQPDWIKVFEPEHILASVHRISE